MNKNKITENAVKYKKHEEQNLYMYLKLCGPKLKRMHKY